MRLKDQMMLRKLVVSFLLAGAFVPHAVLSSSAPHFVHDPRTPSALAHAWAQTPALETSGFDSRYKPSLPQPVQDKNFFLLSLFQRNPAVHRLLSQDKVLKQLAADKVSALKKASTCKDVGCFDQLIRFDGPSIDTVAAELQALANRTEFKQLAKKDLRPSGVFIRYADQSDAQMLVAAWKDAANGMNRILSVYGLGKDPRYKDIDRVSYDVNSEGYRKLIRAKIAEIKLSSDSLFFEPTLNFALALLKINRRDEAGRYEPLEHGENKAAIQNLSKIKWRDYPYTFILVLGSGGRDLSTRISPIGAQRTDVAAQLFLQHKAPLIIVSGGHVHPMQTPFCEAIEMKKYLMEKYKIPETSIFVEPQARHTTTNFRNAARLAFRYRIPTDRTALVTSSEDHIASCASDEFRIRNLNELGYFPIEFIKRTSPVEAEFRPSAASLFFDANDPLDP
jgi:DUF218 domain